jgi:uncharacterized protein YbjT (DUF2867 family)
MIRLQGKGSRLLRVFALGIALLLPGVASAAEVLVFGGTGQLGAQIVRSLDRAGHTVTVFHREGSSLERLQGLPVKFVTGDATREADVVAAFLARRYETTQRAITAGAKAGGVRQVILHSSVGAGESRAIYPEARWPQMAEVLTAKDVAERELIASGVPYTIIRNAVLRNDAPGATERAELTTDQRRFGAVTRSGLGRLTADCALKADCLGRIFHAVDPQVALPAATRGH